MTGQAAACYPFLIGHHERTGDRCRKKEALDVWEKVDCEPMNVVLLNGEKIGK